MTPTRTSLLAALALLSLIPGCSKEDSAPVAAQPDASGSGAPEDGCSRSVLESDLAIVKMKPIGGDGGVAVPASGYVVSTTYLRRREGDAGAARFQELVGPIGAVLATAPGLVGVELGLSVECNTARTFSVWESLDAMYAFATGDAHMDAVRHVSEVSRGGSVVTHWEAKTAADVSWDKAAEMLTDVDSPSY